ncbi:prepilin-type N-terminal cleavage/methylation domain-containing protein [Candidatus Stoquefichus sp. SB1]|uniref:prepilin-type N-terminal cleavage/methylation domain-containing protein n=1 Tax=Candidatus Stoquefichus sp. SB1 TaxID=1658109 RepID=UPI0009E1AB09|nr:prepilin-type N-terminal cleavage/methylation domain-containing protein [Candidatus Stoquefichus sp. SB1]
MKKNKKGFTLIEIIVVVVILAVLMAVAVPSVLKYVDEANDAKYITQARSAYTILNKEIVKAVVSAPNRTLSSADFEAIVENSDFSDLKDICAVSLPQLAAIDGELPQDDELITIDNIPKTYCFVIGKIDDDIKAERYITLKENEIVEVSDTNLGFGQLIEISHEN